LLSLDSHKLHYHPARVGEFLANRSITPLYVEISPAAYCNHRCVFCNFNHLGHRGAFPKGRLGGIVDELAGAGVKSVVFSGIGEPLLNPETLPAIDRAKQHGLDVGMSTNGALLKAGDVEVLSRSLCWIRFSVNGGTPENYAAIHRTRPEDYRIVLDNIGTLRNKKAETGSEITIGSQYIILPQNKDHVIHQAEVMKDLGVDYFVVKHFYDREENEFSIDRTLVTGADLAGIEARAAKMSDESFSFIVRDQGNTHRQREYTTCYGLEFIAYIGENGNVYTCFSHQHDPKTILGNIFEQSFEAIWNSQQKREAIAYINHSIDKNRCQANCRHHQINRYLWELRHPKVKHINFI
jgi:GTP 3',8-cyclase